MGYKWVLKVKKNLDDTINKYKVRIVAKGYHQQFDFDFNGTFSQVVKPITIHVILTLALTNKWKLQQINVNNVFLKGSLQEDINMTQPPDFEKQDPSLYANFTRNYMDSNKPLMHGMRNILRPLFTLVSHITSVITLCSSTHINV